MNKNTQDSKPLTVLPRWKSDVTSPRKRLTRGQLSARHRMLKNYITNPNYSSQMVALAEEIMGIIEKLLKNDDDEEAH